MTIDLQTANSPQSLVYGAVERRTKPRLRAPFSIRIRGAGEGGKRFEIETALDNLSAGGLYAKINRSVALEAKLFCVIRLSTEAGDDASGPRIAVRGIVKRVEIQPDGSCGLAVLFTHHRFL